MRSDEVQKAKETLIRLGVLTKFDDSLKLYHGRAGKKGEDWSVDPNFNNGGNSTGNRNINKIPALNVGDYSVAESFARERALERKRFRHADKDVEAQVHRIVADGEAYILNFSTIPEKDEPAVRDAVRILVGDRLTELAPIPWGDRKIGWIVYKVVSQTAKNNKNYFLQEREVKSLANMLSEPETISSLFKSDEYSLPSPEQVKALTYKIASAYNSRHMLLNNLMPTIDRYILEDNEVSENGYLVMRFPALKIEGGKKVKTILKIPMSSEYISSWLASSNIVGFKRKVNSATLGETIDAYYLFDEERINTEKVIGDKQRQIIEEYETLERISSQFFSSPSEKNKELFELLHNGSPEEIMTHAEGLEAYGELFTSFSGVWEGFTVSEHTESVLRWLDINYENCLPPETNAFLRLCILAHDIGKGHAYEKGLPQKSENKRFADEFFNQIGLDERLKNIAEYVIGDGQSRTTSFYIRKSPDAKNMARKEIKELLTSSYGHTPTEEEINGIWELCSMLQNCDSGSYSLRGITRNKKYGYHLNANLGFTRSFSDPISSETLRGGHLNEPTDD